MLPAVSRTVRRCRLHRSALHDSIDHADDQILVIQHAGSIPIEREPVLYVRSVAAADMTTTYLDAFERIGQVRCPCSRANSLQTVERRPDRLLQPRDVRKGRSAFSSGAVNWPMTPADRRRSAFEGRC